jgi:cell division protein FtsI (penicillin-binding protein 3)/stage V sporulation protein D (sporulation-specific penicillin-binding protein)
MMFGGKKNLRRRDRENNGRLNLVVAIIFLLAFLLIGRLFSLQVFKHDLYIALASDQHLVYSQLEPDRGEIFFQDNPIGDSSKLYPVATNKEFALIYAVPSMIEKPQEVAEKIFEIFDKEKVEKEVDELLEEDEYFQESDEEMSSEEFKIKEEFKKVKREAEIKTRQEKIIKSYLKKLEKKADPYEPLKKKVDEDKLKELMDLNIIGIRYVMQQHRYYPEGRIGSHMLGFVGYSGDEEVGCYGLEGFFDEELSGQKGSIRTERSADGNPIIVNDREYNQAKDGSDLVLTINRSIQYVVCNKLYEEAEKYDVEKGSIIVMEPKSGAILAMCSWPDYDPNYYNQVEDIKVYNNSAIFDEYEPGSIFKTITIAAGLDQGVIEPHTLYRDKGEIMIEGWPKPIGNSDFETHGPWGIVDMTTVLEQSLNTGSIYVMQEMGPKIFANYVKKFGFGEKMGIELETEGQGTIRNLLKDNIRPIEAATASFGQGITTTPLQMVSAYAAIANGGILMKPYLVDDIISPDGLHYKTQPKQIGRIISERSALLALGMMVKVVDGGHASLAGVPGYFVGGKTGTAQVADLEKGGYSEDKTIHTFVGFAPADDAKFVMLVRLDDPKGVDYSASSAAPLFGDIADFILDYYQVPKQR